MSRRGGLFGIAARSRLDLFFVCLAVAVAAWIETRALDSKSLWIDEILSRTYASQSVSGLFTFFVHGELNMALYHLALHYWLYVGDSEVAIRTLSVLFALAALPFAYALGARLLSRRAGALAAILLALNGAFYSFAREARGYSLTILLVTAASFFFVRAVDRGRKADWTFYVFTAGLSVYAHLFAMTVVLAHFLSLALPGRPLIDRRRAYIAGAGVVVLLSPAAVYVVTGDTSLTTDTDTHLRDVVDLFRWYASGNRPLLLLFLVGALAAVVSAVRGGIRSGAAVAWPQSFLAVWLGVPIVAALAVSFTIDPIFEFRYLLVLLPAFILLVADGVAGVTPAVLFVVLAIAASAISARSLDRCSPGCATPTQDFRAATALIHSRAATGDEIFFDPPYLAYAFAYYISRIRGADGFGKRDGVPMFGQGRPSGPARRAWVLVDQGDPNSAAYRGRRHPFGNRWRLAQTNHFESLLLTELYIRRP